MPFRMLSSNLGFYPLDASSISPCPPVLTQMKLSPDFDKRSLGDKNQPLLRTTDVVFNLDNPSKYNCAISYNNSSHHNAYL